MKKTNINRRRFSQGLAGSAVAAGAVAASAPAKADEAIKTTVAGVPQLVSALPVTPHTYADVSRIEGQNTLLTITSTRAIGSAHVELAEAGDLIPDTSDTFFTVKQKNAAQGLSFDVSCASAGQGAITLTRSGAPVDALNVVCADGMHVAVSFEDGLPVYPGHDEANKMRPSLNS